MKKLDKIMDVIENASFTVLFSVMIAVVFAQVICRYILHASIPWSEELSRYCMIYVVFIGVSAGLKAGSHTGVDAVVEALHGKVKWTMVFIQRLLVTVLTITFFWITLKYSIQLFQTKQLSSTLKIPIAIAYAAMPIGFGAGIIRSVQLLIGLFHQSDEKASEL